MKRILLTAAALLFSAAAHVPAQAHAEVGFSITIGNAPPPPRYEVVPSPRRGLEWAPGYWNWNGRRHVWVPGHWERARPGHYYKRPEWRQVRGGWRLEQGRWERGGWEHGRRHDHHQQAYRAYGYGDRDRDGVPNRVDRDRDGDGVANRYDRRPDNPRRD